jgi:hypothetical protein
MPYGLTEFNTVGDQGNLSRCDPDRPMQQPSNRDEDHG